MAGPLDDAALDLVFRTARTRNAWSGAPLKDADMRAIYDLARMGPTSANCSPARFVWVTSAEAKDKLAACASSDNAPKIRKAPATVIVGYDLGFAETLPRRFPQNPTAQIWFASPEVAQITAFRNGTLQGAYLILAARALGFDCGPMSGFDNAKVDGLFFVGTQVKSNFICSIGHAAEEPLPPRPPRAEFEEVCRIV